MTSWPGSTTAARHLRRSARWPDTVHALGFSWRKRRLLQQFVTPARVLPMQSVSALPAGAALALWGSAPVPPGLRPDVRVLRFEDGFLRSVGLGADLVRPLSWVADGRGMYYDASVPSDLEVLLESISPDEALLERAATLRQAIVAACVTKYNLAAPAWKRPAGASRVVLVPGQVESDASIAAGAGPLRTNLELLQEVRAARPDAYLLYKPHPDVVAGLRSAGYGEDLAAQLADEVVAQADMSQLLAAVDEVHVITSLSGFEALLRGVPVTTWGTPFYAGWGLTCDRGLQSVAAARRTRRLTLDALVAGALIAYPMYLSPHTGAPTTAEAALVELQAERANGAALPWWRRMLRPALGLAARWRGQ